MSGGILAIGISHLLDLFNIKFKTGTTPFYVFCAILIIFFFILFFKIHVTYSKKFMWVFQDGIIRNRHIGLEILPDQILKIYVGVERKLPFFYKPVSYLNIKIDQLRVYGDGTTLALILTENKVIYLNLNLLGNGNELFNRILESNAHKIQEGIFKPSAHHSTIVFKNIKCFKILDI